MAKVKLSGFFQSMWGRLGDFVIARRKGGHCIIKLPKKIKIQKTPLAQKMKEDIVTVTKLWSQLPMEQQMLWEMYAKMLGYHSGCAMQAFLKINLTLAHNGLKLLKKPPLWKKQPPQPKTDIINFGRYKDKVKFNIWIEEEFEDRCFAKVMVKSITRRKELERMSDFYTAIYPLPEIKYNQKIEIVIDKIKVNKKGKIIEIPIKKLAPYRIFIQIKNVSEYGKISLSSGIYKVEII